MPTRIMQTRVPPPRERVFLHQSFGERAASALWTIVWTTLFRWSPPFATAWRVLLLRLFRAKVGRRVSIAPSARVWFPWNLRLGDEVRIHHGVIMNCMGRVEIGRETHVSQYAHLCAATHEHTEADMPIIRSPISIGERCWIAADSFVGPNVTIGINSVLAARSSAFGNLPADCVCVGEPAVPVKPRDA